MTCGKSPFGCSHMARKSISACSSSNIDWPRNDTDPSQHCHNRKPVYKYYTTVFFIWNPRPSVIGFSFFSWIFIAINTNVSVLSYIFAHRSLIFTHTNLSIIFIHRLKSSRNFSCFQTKLTEAPFQKVGRGNQARPTRGDSFSRSSASVGVKRILQL